MEGCVWGTGFRFPLVYWELISVPIISSKINWNYPILHSVTPERIWKRHKKFFRALHFFSSTSAISRFRECHGQYIQFGQFLVCCSSTHGAPRAQPFLNFKSGGGGARAPVPYGCSRRHCLSCISTKHYPANTNHFERLLQCMARTESYGTQR